MAQRRATEEIFFCICKEGWRVWNSRWNLLFSRCRRNRRCSMQRKKMLRYLSQQSIRYWKLWLGHLIKQRQTMVSKEDHRTGKGETAEEAFLPQRNLRKTKSSNVWGDQKLQHLGVSGYKWLMSLGCYIPPLNTAQNSGKITYFILLSAYFSMQRRCFVVLPIKAS